MNLDNIDISKLPADIRKQYKQLQVLHAEKKIQNKAKNDFLSFVKCVWPDFVEGSHHRHIADKFNKLATGEINRLIINMPPRHTKSGHIHFTKDRKSSLALFCIFFSACMTCSCLNFLRTSAGSLLISIFSKFI